MKDWKGTPMRDVVNDPEWQKLRGDLVGTWTKNQVENVKRLRAYVNKDRKDALRWVRVFNYLTGTAFRLGKISHPSIVTLRKEVTDKLRQLKSSV